jgi:hypothetical protein
MTRITSSTTQAIKSGSGKCSLKSFFEVFGRIIRLIALTIYTILSKKLDSGKMCSDAKKYDIELHSFKVAYIIL